MATRIFRMTATLAAGQSNLEMTGSPLAPPSGIKWTVVELRAAFANDGFVQGFFDTELYHSLDSRVTDQVNAPRVVALDVVQPHRYRVLVSDLSGAGGDVEVEVTAEESPQGA